MPDQPSEDIKPLKRRRSDQCIAKHLYESATPYIQIAGWLPVIGGIASAVYLICVFINNTEGYATQISTVDSKVDKVNDKVLGQQQDITSLKKGQEDMAKEVHLIYQHLIGNEQ